MPTIYDIQKQLANTNQTKKRLNFEMKSKDGVPCHSKYKHRCDREQCREFGLELPQPVVEPPERPR